MPRHLLRAIVLVSVIGCTPLERAGDRPRFQSFDYGNDGVGRVTNVEIRYGNLILPTSHSVREGLFPTRFHIAVFGESQDSAIPTQSVAYWTSANGVRHSAIIPVRQLIPDVDAFKGFEFYFVDDHLDVYLKALGPRDAKYKEILATKIFSSPVQ